MPRSALARLYPPAPPSIVNETAWVCLDDITVAGWLTIPECRARVRGTVDGFDILDIEIHDGSRWRVLAPTPLEAALFDLIEKLVPEDKALAALHERAMEG